MPKIPFHGSMVDADPIGFTVTEDPWQQLTLADGTQLRLKPVVVEVLKTTATDQDGQPVYAVKTHLVVVPTKETAGGNT